MNRLPILRIHIIGETSETKIKLVPLLFLEDVSGLGGHAVDAPVRLAVVIADGDGEPAVVGADDLDVLLGLLALDQQLLALAGVPSPDGRARELAWKMKQAFSFDSQISYLG